MDVSVIIVTYNSATVINPCLESLRPHVEAGEAEVIVVDNASHDGTPDIVRQRFSWVQLIAGDENLGYSRGVNVGIRSARGRYFFILNPDTVMRGDALSRLVQFMDRTADAGIAAPKLVFQDGNVQLSCRRFYTFKVLLLRRTPFGKIFKNARVVDDHLMLDFDHNSTREVDWVLGAAMMVRREAVENVGMMDERFFLYFEDVDWCYRMKQNDLKVYYCADAVVVHGYARDSAQSVINRSFVSHLVSLFRYYEKWHAVAYFLKRYREVAKIVLFLILDVIAFNAAFLSAYYLRIGLDDVLPNPIFPISAYERFIGFENLLFVFSFFAVGLYKIRRETHYTDEFFKIARAIVLASVLLMTSTYLGQIRTYSRLVVAFVVPFAILYDWSLRTMLRRLHRRLLALKVDLKRACIVGPKTAAQQLESRLSRDDRLGIDVVGIVDTGDESRDILTGTLGRVDNIERIVDKYRVQHVIVMSGAVGEERLAGIVAMGRRRVLDITVLTDYTALVFHQATVTDLQGRPVIMYPRDTRYAIDRTVKRALDAVVGAVLVVVSLPFYVLYSLYALSRGVKPFIYNDRLGSEGEPFTIPMAGGDRTDGPSDLVNLPLFWLVAIGRMSVVGPYALSPGDAEYLTPGARFRFDVRPGVTGYWRMSPERVSLDDVLAQDANYVRNWSLIQDMKILLATGMRVLTGRRRTLAINRREGIDEVDKNNE